MEVEQSKLYLECAEDIKQSAEREDTGEPEDVKYVNTQDYLDIGETIVGLWNREAPELAATLGYIKEEYIDPDDAQILTLKEKIGHLINKKVEVKQETDICIKAEEQIKAEPSIISRAENVPVDSMNGSVIQEESCTSSELEILKAQVASWRVILHRLPTDTPIPATTTSDCPVATGNEITNNKFKEIEELPRTEAPHDVTEIEKVDKIGSENEASKKLMIDIQHNLAKKHKKQTETNTPINDTVLCIPDQELCNPKKNICVVCQAKFNSKIKLQQHMIIHSSTFQTYHTCPTCNYKCVTIQLFEKHVRLHDENRRYACNLCTYRFSTNICLKHHVKVHTGEMRYRCDMCDYASVRSDNLKTHMRTHTNEKIFKCDTCDYCCFESGNMKKHMIRHKGKKQFKCNTCDYAASVLSNLKRHMRTHTGEKSFKCDTCDYVCSRLDHLKSHMGRHTGEKPFKCDLCEYRCFARNTLIRHEKRHLAPSSVSKIHNC